MSKRFSFIASMVLAAAIPLVVIAEPQGPRRGGNGGDHSTGPGGAGGSRMDREEWGKNRIQQAEEFYKKHAPNRWSEFEKQRAKVSPDRAKQMMAGMFARFQGLQMQHEDKDLFDIRVQQIEVEDTEFGLVMNLSTTDKAQTEQIDKLTTELRSNAQKSVDLRLKEKGLRLARLAKILEKEKVAYEADLKNEDALVSDRVKLMISEGPEFFTPKRMHHGEGPSTSPTTSHTAQ
jgi:hypothetical protein